MSTSETNKRERKTNRDCFFIRDELVRQWNFFVMQRSHSSIRFMALAFLGLWKNGWMDGWNGIFMIISVWLAREVARNMKIIFYILFICCRGKWVERVWVNCYVGWRFKNNPSYRQIITPRFCNMIWCKFDSHYVFLFFRLTCAQHNPSSWWRFW